MSRTKGCRNPTAACTKAAIFAAILVSPIAGFAQSTYVGSSGGNWSTPGNWSPSGVPGNGADALITESSGSPFTVNFDYTGYSTSTALSSLTLDSSGSAAVKLNQTLSTASMFATNENIGNNGIATYSQTAATNTATNLYLGSNPGSNGTYSLSGGALSVSNGGNGDTPTYLAVGYQGTGTFTQTNGDITISAATYDSESPYAPYGLLVGTYSGMGSYSISGGTLTDTGTAVVGAFTTGTFSQMGGTVSLNASADYTDALSIGGNGAFNSVSIPGAGNYNLSLGELDVFNNEDIGADGTGIFTQTGGTHSISDGISDNLYIGSDVDLQQDISNGTYSLSGTGTLTVGGNVYVGGTSLSSAGGIGLLSIGGGLATIDGTLQVNATGTTVTVSGGTLTVGNTVNAGTITQTGGTTSLGPLTGSGNIAVGNASGSSASMTVSAIQQNTVTVKTTGLLTVTGGSANTISSLVNNGTTDIEASAMLSSLSGTGTLNITPGTAANSTVQLALNSGGSTQGGLTIAANSALDITNNHLILTYTSGTKAALDSAIRTYLINGYHGGAWNGTSGINSSQAALPANSHYGLGYADGADNAAVGISSGQLEVKYTLYGDADLDGSVTGTDFTALVSNLGKSGRVWDQGDFDYDGNVTGADFTALLGNLGKTATGAAVVIPASDLAAIDAFAAANGLMADVPEPASAGLILMAGVGMLARRRRNSRVLRDKELSSKLPGVFN